MKRLTVEQIKRLHSMLIAETGGTDGVRDEGMLESAAMSPFQSFGGMDLYPSLKLKAARLGYQLIKNHPFLDGNKRIGAHIMLVFLDINGIELEYTQDDFANIILAVAAGEKGYEDLLNWIGEHQA